MIDNKTIFFHKELRDHITSETELCIQCQSITFLALAKFLTGLNGSRKINVLIGAENKTLENFTSAEIDVKVQNELETLQQAINLMESSSNTLSIRSGLRTEYRHSEESRANMVLPVHPGPPRH